MAETAKTPNILNLLSEETFADKMDRLTAIIAAGSSKGDGLAVSSWADVQKIVRLGLADKVFNIGDQLISTKGSQQLTWDIIGIDQDTPADKLYTHSLTIQMHDCYTTAQFDAAEALYYAETGLVAGTYNFTLLSDYDTAYGGGKTYQFTLTKAVPARGQLVFSWGWNVQASTCKISSYENAMGTTVIETVSVKEGSGGTSLGTADGTTTNMNHAHRMRYGSNDWIESALRQWLNSDEAAGAWWVNMTDFDRPPTNAATTAGFLNGMDSEFLSAIGKVKKRTALNTVTDGGGYTDSEELMFLISRSEIYAGLENNVNEGEPYAYYKDNSDLSSASGNADTNRIKYLNGSAKYWWLRSPYSGYGYGVRRVLPTGSLYTSDASTSNGVAPACCIV